MSRSRIFIGGCIGLVIVSVICIAGLLVFSNSFTGPVPPPLQLSEQNAEPQQGNTASLEGTWVAGDGSVAGFRVPETFLVQHSTIVGRTSAVTGSLVFEHNQVSSGSFQVDLRDVIVGGKPNPSFFKLLETDKYPTAAMKLTQPIVLQTIPTNGQTISLRAPASLTIHGITRMVTLAITLRENGSQIEAAGSAPFLASDWDVKSPYAVHNDAVIEFLLMLHKS